MVLHNIITFYKCMTDQYNTVLCTYTLIASRDFCLAGLQLTVFRAGRKVNETIPVGTILNSTESTTLRTDGPVVAFYGLIPVGIQSCIVRLGGYRLLQSSELNSECMHV